MRHLTTLFATIGLLAGCALVGTQGDHARADAKPSGQEQMLVELRAMVAGVDQKRRLLALKGDDGTTTVMAVAEGFRDFDKLRAGDPVVVSYREAVAWQVKPAEKGAPGFSTRESLVNPGPGEATGGSLERAVTVTATISGLDAGRGTVTLTGSDGRSQTVKVRNPADLDRVRVGDLVDITFTEVRALAVRPLEKR